MSYQDKLKAMQKNWKESKKTAEQFELFPAGTFVMKLKSSELGERDNGSIYILSKWVALDDEVKGRTFSEFQNIHEDRLGFIHRWFNSMGFEAPENISDIPAMLEKLVDAAVVVKMSVKHTTANDREYANGTIRGVVDYDSPAEEIEKASEVEEEAEEEEVTAPKPKSKANKDLAILKKVAVRSQLDIDDDITIDAIVEELNGYSWSIKADKLTTEEVEMFDKYDISYKK